MHLRIRQEVERHFQNFELTEALLELREEIILNMEERYASHVAEGMDPEAAFTLCIESLGDLHEAICSLQLEAQAEEGHGDYAVAPYVAKKEEAKNEQRYRRDEQRPEEIIVEDAHELSEIALAWRSGDIRLSSYGGDSLRIRESSDPLTAKRHPIRIKRKQGRLDIRFDSDPIHVSWKRKTLPFYEGPSKDLEILLPEKAMRAYRLDLFSALSTFDIQELYVKHIKLHLFSGALLVHRLIARSLNLSGIAARLALHELDGVHCSFQTVSGHLDLEDSSCQDVTLKSVSGSLFVKRTRLEKLSISGVSSSMALEDSQVDEISSKSVSGNLHLKNVPVVGPEVFKGTTLFGRKHRPHVPAECMHEKGASRIEFSSVTGRLSYE